MPDWASDWPEAADAGSSRARARVAKTRKRSRRLMFLLPRPRRELASFYFPDQERDFPLF